MDIWYPEIEITETMVRNSFRFLIKRAHSALTFTLKSTEREISG
jgi:hypothetical protein